MSDIATVLPEEVSAHMENLITRYNQIQTPTVHDLAAFHAEYENIHPFQDRNGRTDRMILFRESLKHSMIPIIIHNENQARYSHRLNNAQPKGILQNLTDYFEEEQNAFYEETKAAELLYDVISDDPDIE